MKATIIIKLLYLGFVVVLLQACYKDKGNYDLVDYNKVTSITSLSAKVVILGDTLKIIPDIKWKYPDKDTLAFSYEWREGDVVVSTERNLSYVPSKTGAKGYFLYITEKETNIVSRFTTFISINSPYRAGWILLADQEGKSELSYINRSQWTDADQKVHKSYVLYPNIYASSFAGEPLGSGPQKLVTKIFPDYLVDEVLVIQDDQTVFLNGSDFSKIVYLKNEFPGGVYPVASKPKDYVDGASSNFVLFENGEVFWKMNEKIRGGLHEGLFMNVPMYFEGGGSFISSFIDNEVFRSRFLYMYDGGNNRFIGSYVTTGTGNEIGKKTYLVNATPPPPEFVDLTKLSGYKVLYSADYANSSYYMNIIKQESSGNYYYQTYRTAQKSSHIEISEHQQELFAANDIVSDKTVYQRAYSSSYLYFGEGSKLFFYDVNTKRVKLYKDFGSGSITKMTTDADDGELGVVLNNGSFFICSLKNTVLGENDPGATGILYEAHNLGKVVDLKWKWGGYSEYFFRAYPK